MLIRRGLVFFTLVLGACGTDISGRTNDGGGVLGTDDASDTGDGPNMSTPDGGAMMSCYPDQPDQSGCACDTPGATRACYPSSQDPKTRNVGPCKDGSQSCTSGGEFSAWGPCTGAATPHQEICTNKTDDDCNGLTDCADPGCAGNPNCNTACTNGQTRPCYDGPSGTNNVGTCHSGTQTCTNGKWSSGCPGEVTPTAENCADDHDHNCNHLPGCLDFLSCITSPACMPMCKPDPGCVCPTGGGETATCPEHMHGVSSGGLTNQNVQCCACTAKDCGSDAACCAEPVCAGASACKNFTCAPLPASCKGQQGFDCDDFNEDCDVLCCPCTACP